MSRRLFQEKPFFTQGQLISKNREFFQKRTNEFVFTAMRRVFFFFFLEEIEDTKKNLSKLLDL